MGSDSKSITITARQLRWLTTCKRHIWLNVFGDDHPRDEPEPSFLYRVDQGIREATTERIEMVPVGGWYEAVESTNLLMEQGVHGIIAG